jgi:copper transport protein
VRRLAALALACGITVALAPMAGAHAALERSDPADGALLQAAPSAITLSFTEPPDPELSEVRILDSSGAEVAVSGEVRQAGNVLRVTLPENLPDGVYTVAWRVVSKLDSHLTAGAFAFGVGVETVGTPQLPEAMTPAPSPAAVVGRALLYAGVAVLIAAALVGRLAFRGAVPARRPLLLGASAALGSGVTLMVLAQASTVEVGVVRLFGTQAGRPYAWLAGITILTAAAGVEAALGSGRRALLLAGVGAAAAALVRAMGGHAAAAPTPPLHIALQWIHVLAVSTWIGGLVLLALRARANDDRLALDARRFSSIAVVAAPMAVLAGTLRATGELGGPGWFLRSFDTTYRTTLVIKIVAVVGLLALGGWNRFRGIARLEAGRASPLRRTVLAEVAVAACVLGLTGTLTGLPPRPDATGAGPAAPVAVVARATDFAGTIEVVLRADPGTPGPNRFTVRLLEPVSGEPVHADAVSLRFEPLGVTGIPASGVELMHDGVGWEADGANLSIAGTWEIRATVRRDADAVEVPLALTTRAPAAEVTRADAPGQPTLTTVTLPDGTSLQTYLDPGDPGTSQVHVTAFDGSGGELPLEAATFVAFPPSVAPIVLDPERFGEGHFVGTVELVGGRWRFAITATTRDGPVLQSTFSRTIGAV